MVWPDIPIATLAWLGGAILLSLIALALLIRRRPTPGSADAPHEIKIPRGGAPDLRGSHGYGHAGAATERAERVIHDMRTHAAEQLIDHIGGVYAPDALYSLLAEIGDPAAAVARLIELLGENPAAVVGGPGESRTAFLDRLDAFVQLEAEVRAISPDSNRQIFMLLREGRADDVRLWASAVRNARETEALLAHAETLAPGPIGSLEALKGRAGALSKRARVFLPPNVAALASEVDALKLSAQALFRFAEDWHALDRTREIAEEEIRKRWNPVDPFCQALLPRMEPLFANIELAWKTIGQRRSGVAELRGLLDDLERQLVALAQIAQELKDYATSHAHSGGARSGSGPHSRRSGTYGPDGRDRASRAHADPHHDLWAYFDFDHRPTFEECRMSRNAMARKHHPDRVGDAGREAMQEINAKWAAAQAILRGVTA